MTTKLIKWNHINIEDKTGMLRPLRGCPISKLGELEAIVKQIWQAMAQYPDVTVVDIVHNSEEIRDLHAKALRLCGLDPDWLDVDMVVQLLHQYQTEAGVRHFGLLIEQNLPRLCVVESDRQALNEEIEKTHQVLNEVSEQLEELIDASTNSF